MSKKDEALKLALEALEDAKKNHGLVYVTELCAIRSALAEQPAQQRTDYAWPTLADYERDVGFQTNEAFRAAWNMARTTNKMLGFSEPQPAQDQGQSCYCPECERLSKELAALKAQQQEPVAWMYQCSADSSGPVLMQHKRDWAESGSGLWTETPLYTSPPAQQREFVGLTDDDIESAMPGGIYDCLGDPWDCGVGDGDYMRSIKKDVLRVARAAIAAYEEKNGITGEKA